MKKPPVPKAGGEFDWAKSSAKRLIMHELKVGNIPYDGSMKPRVVWNKYVDDPRFFDRGEYRLFAARLRAARQQAEAKHKRSQVDYRSFMASRAAHPAPTHNHRGEPRWPGSPAEKRLRDDMDAGKHTTQGPGAMYRSSPVYQDYPQAVIRKHIHQEESLRKFQRQWDAEEQD